MRPLAPWLRPLPYVLFGLLFGFLFLAEFGLMASVVVEVALLVLATVGLGGVVLRRPGLELWPLFVAAAMVTPLVVDSHVVGLPACGQVPPGVACAAGASVAPRFVTELLIFAVSVAAVFRWLVRELHERGTRPRDN